MVIIDKRESVEMRQFNDFVKSKHFKIFLERKRVDKKCLKDMDGLKLARNYLYEELEQYLPKDQIERRVDFKDANDMKMQIGKYWSQYRQIVEAHENNKTKPRDINKEGVTRHLGKGPIRQDETPPQPKYHRANGLPPPSFFHNSPKRPRA